MKYKIMVGDYVLKAIHSVTIVKSVENLADTATIIIPGTYINKAIQIEGKIKEGDAVEIWLGYRDALCLEFKGYLNTISTDDAAIRIDCMDALYLFKKTISSQELKDISLKSLLKKISAEVNAINHLNGTPSNYMVDCSYEFVYEKFVTFHFTALDVLKKVQEETRANIYFEGETLHIHPPYEDIKNKIPVIFDFSRNIESSDLKYVRKEDKKIEVEVTAYFPDGKNKTEKFGNPGGVTVKKISGSENDADMKKIAEDEYNVWNYDGYEGSFTGWLIPFVEPACKIRLQDKEYPRKDGNYYVVGVEVGFSSSGGSRKISIGRRLS